MNPKIRFKADDGSQFPDWKECRVNDITTISGGYAFSSEKMKDNPSMYQVIKMGNLYQGKLDLSRTPSYIESINEKEKEYLLKNGDIAITLTGTVNKHDYGYSYLFTEENNLLLNQRLGLIRKKGSNDSRFILSVIKGNRFLKQFYSSATGGTGNQTNVSTKSVENIKIIVPHPDEQKKIADFLSDIDSMISVQEHQLAILEEQKKGVMQKIFSQEVKFKDDNGNEYPEWEEKRLGDECKIIMGQSPDGDTYSKTPSKYILVQGNADLKDGWVCPRIWTTQKTKVAKAGDLIMSVRAPAGTIGKTSYDVVLGRGVAAIKGNEFIYQTLVKMDKEKYWNRFSSGSTFESINSDALLKAKIYIPKNVEEQKKIADFLSDYDKAIEIKKKKIEAWENIKVGLLQQMFI